MCSTRFYLLRITVLISVLALSGCASEPPTAKEKAKEKAEAAHTLNENRVAPGYSKAQEKFAAKLRGLPDVGATQIFGDDAIRVYLQNHPADDQSKFIANRMYRQFVQMRSRYMKSDKAQNCTIFLKDENGDTLYDAAYYTQ